ncbi:amidohydrolase family protein [Hymenobacter humi]|uniref:Amidohydrolase family protein n=1 Tax=Hymenobacter humi TaxID=1411620 RepID=A0ABW2U9D5_9BACT
MLWTAARQRGATLPDLARWLSENPAQLIGQSHKKGRIAVGYDADLIVLDPEKSFVVQEEMIQHKHKVSPYICQELWGVVEQTFLKGKQVYEHPMFTQLNQGEIITR